LLGTYTASNSASLDITGLSSTYKSYEFVFIHLKPATDAVNLRMRVTTDGGATYINTGTSYVWNLQSKREAGSLDHDGTSSEQTISSSATTIMQNTTRKWHRGDDLGLCRFDHFDSEL
jgi:hypothetical protein